MMKTEAQPSTAPGNRKFALVLSLAVGYAAFLPGICRAEGQAVATWGLVETIGDPEKKSRTDTNTAQAQPYTDTYKAGVGTVSYESRRPDEKHFQGSATFEAPPARLEAGQEFTVKVTGTAIDNEKSPSNGGLAIDYWADSLTRLSREGPGSVGRWSDGTFHSTGTRTYKFRVPADAPEEFTITAGSYGMIVATSWRYRKGATPPAATPTPSPTPKPAEEAHLTAYLDVGTVEVCPDQFGVSCKLVISGWKHNTSKRVEVVFPLQSDGVGSQDAKGFTGVVVPIGQSSEDPANMGGFRGADGSYGKEYPWTVFVRARGNAPIGTVDIPITVRQEGAGEAKVTLKVRVVPGLTKQVGPDRDGTGVPTGDKGGGAPPIISGVSATGLTARLETGRLALVPGHVGQSCTIFIKGWRTNTADQVQVFLPQESEPRGNLGNDLVAFPGNSKLDPSNMAKDGNGEYPFVMNFRAMERAIGGTTMIDIFVRQSGHQPVALRLALAVDTSGRATPPSATPTPKPTPTPTPVGPVHATPPGPIAAHTSVLPCSQSDRGAGSTNLADHLRWAQNRPVAELAANLDTKLNLLFQCPGITEDQASSAFASLSVVIAQTVPDVNVFGGDAAVVGTDWAAHKRAFLNRPNRIGVLLDNARWKTAAAIKHLDPAQQATFFAEISVAIARGAVVPK